MDGTLARGNALDTTYLLDDNLLRTQGQVFLTGTQALVRALLAQRRLDRENGVNSAGFVSGYRGSPLAGLDLAFWRARTLLDENQLTFVPAVNEDMAATMLMGTQHAGQHADRTVDGVFGMWYGKGPGVDRAGDAIHHASAAGASRHGGVLLVVGDDHNAASSSIPHASEASLTGWSIPVVHPASVDEYETYALWAWALSRHSGAWVAFKAVTETVESGRTVALRPPRHLAMPDDAGVPAEALGYTTADFLSPAIEMRIALRMRAVAAFARRHSLDTLARPAPKARIGIVTVGKAHLDTLEALRLLGMDNDAVTPIRIYRPGLTWPLEETRLLEFANGLDHILVVEEKGAVVETQVKDLLFNRPGRPSVSGKHDIEHRPLIPSAGQLQPSQLLQPLSAWLQRAWGRAIARTPMPAGPAPLSNEADGMRRQPYFCAGCPHSTSTRVPAGSTAQGGVGCHYMAAWMDRDTAGLTQMGGEGADWIALSRYTTVPHVFQNMGEGTYFHSGYLAIRQAVAARANITYKILFNDAVAMTGGQPVDGPISVPAVCNQVIAEGVRRIAITSDDPGKYEDAVLPAGVTVHHRRELDAVQRELRALPGVTVLVHDQACAAEKRRRRKKKAWPDPPRRIFINTAVCEGCGDCGVQSNCLAIVPVETPYGRKRAVDQSSCNKDYACADGFCPSFVSVIGGKPRKGAQSGSLTAGARSMGAESTGTRTLDAQSGMPPANALERLRDAMAALPLPSPVVPDTCNLVVAGIGGTGVITISALVSMAAHLEGRCASVLDMTGLAQKGGSVISHIRLAPHGPMEVPVRVDRMQADVAILCDMVAAIAPGALSTLRHAHTRAVVNNHVAPLAAFTRDPDAAFRPQALLAKIRHAVGTADTAELDAHALAVNLFGDSILGNLLLLGYAWQRGWLPVGLDALHRAIELNGVAPQANKLALDAGRLAAHAPAAMADLLAPAAQVVQLQVPESFEHAVDRREQDLRAYQDAAYAHRFRAFVDQVAQRERALEPAPRRSQPLALAVARSLYQLMAYKDEYEVARLYTDGGFQAQLRDAFEGDFSLRFHMAPPLFSRKDPATGRPSKVTLGPGTLAVLKLLARLKTVRGTKLDVFGYSAERRAERALINEYMAAMQSVCRTLDAARLPQAIAIATLAQRVRGYGPIKRRAIDEYRAALSAALQAYGAPASQPVFSRKIA